MVAICQGSSYGKFPADSMSKGITEFQLHVNQADQHFRDNWAAVIFHSTHTFLRGRIIPKSSPVCNFTSWAGREIGRK